MKIQIIINEQIYTATLINNQTTKELQRRLPFTITMNDLHYNEKYFYFKTALSTKVQHTSQIHCGDIKLFGNNCLVLFYQDFTTAYAYTPIGFIDDPQGLVQALGKGSVSVIFKNYDNHDK